MFFNKLIKKIIYNNNSRLNKIDEKIKLSSAKTEELKLIQKNLLDFQSKLIENQNKLLSIIETIYEAIFVIDIDTNVLLWNKSAERIFGYTFEEIKHLGITVLMNDYEKENFLNTFKLLKEKFKNNEPINFKKEITCSFAISKNKEIVPIKYSVISWRNNGSVYFTYSVQELYVFNDCFTFKEVYDTIINNLNFGVCITNLNFDLIYINNYLLNNILFNKRVNLIGKKIFDIFKIENFDINNLNSIIYKNDNGKEFKLNFKKNELKNKLNQLFIFFIESNE